MTLQAEKKEWWGLRDGFYGYASEKCLLTAKTCLACVREAWISGREAAAQPFWLKWNLHSFDVRRTGTSRTFLRRAPPPPALSSPSGPLPLRFPCISPLWNARRSFSVVSGGCRVGVSQIFNPLPYALNQLPGRYYQNQKTAYATTELSHRETKARTKI